MPVGDLGPELALLIGSVVALLYTLFAPRRLQGGAAAISYLAVATSLVLTGLLARGVREGRGWLTFSDSYAVDGAALAAKVLVLLATAFVVLLSRRWFGEDRRAGEFHVLLLLSALGVVLLAGAADLMEIILGILLSSATGYVLAGYHRLSRRSTEAAVKYYLLSAITNGVMVYGVVLLAGLGGTTTLSGLRLPLLHADAVALVAASSLLVVGLAFKMGAVPAHAWMPDVAEGAPAPVAAFLTVVPKVGAFLALARLLSVLPEQEVAWRPLMAMLAAATMTLGNLAALSQEDVRRLLGWSAVSQTGYGLMALVALGRSELALGALLYFLSAYTLGGLTAFGVVTQLRGLTARADYAALGITRPGLALALVVSLLSFVGIPPTAGFAAKLALFGATIEAGYAWLAVVAVINSVISLAYYARILAPMYFEPRAEPRALLGGGAGPAAIAAAVALLAVGIFAQALVGVMLPLELLPR